ncbi:MAG: hypothetical protein ABIR79_13055 [Candidatus Binatia bacterium]
MPASQIATVEPNVEPESYVDVPRERSHAPARILLAIVLVYALTSLLARPRGPLTWALVG